MDENKKIHFSTNWNKKLNNDSFTTLRLKGDKYCIGETYHVFFKGHLKDVKVLDKKTLYLEQINEYIAQLDTGYSREECINIIKRMYASRDINWAVQPLELILLKTIV